MGRTTKEMILVDINKLIPYINNARTHSPEQISKLRASLREFGFVNPVIIDKDFNIIAGHGRVIAAKAEGIEEVPCVLVDYLTEAQKKAYIIADNRMALDAGWDEEILKVELEALEAEDFDLAFTGFDEKEIEHLFQTKVEVEDDDYDLSAALEKASFVERGDVWVVGRHRLVCGDATNIDDVKKLMDGKRANLVLTDPPYGVDFKSSSGLTIKNDALKGDNFVNFLFAAFKNMVDHCEPGASAYKGRSWKVWRCKKKAGECHNHSIDETVLLEQLGDVDFGLVKRIVVKEDRTIEFELVKFYLPLVNSSSVIQC